MHGDAFPRELADARNRGAVEQPLAQHAVVPICGSVRCPIRPLSCRPSALVREGGLGHGAPVSRAGMLRSEHRSSASSRNLVSVDNVHKTP